MHRCSSTQGPCTCGWFQAPNNSFSMFFSMPNHQPYDDLEGYPVVTSSSSSSVDCTLSLGTPSTRQTNTKSNENRQRSSSSCVWDIFSTKKPSKSSRGSSSGSTNSVLNSSLTGDSLLARRCANCDTTSTPLWRNGPRGPKSLCNACGIRYKKEERRASTTSNATAAAATVIDPQHFLTHHQQNSWNHQSNEFRFIEDNECNSPFLSWRLNVPDRSGLVHDY